MESSVRLLPHRIAAAADNSSRTDGEPAEASGYDLVANVAGVFIVLVASAVGIMGTLLLSHKAWKHSPSVLFVFQILKFFGVGVIISTAWIHLITDANEQFTGNVPESFKSYGAAWTGLFAMMGTFLFNGVEFYSLQRSRALLANTPTPQPRSAKKDSQESFRKGDADEALSLNPGDTCIEVSMEEEASCSPASSVTRPAPKDEENPSVDALYNQIAGHNLHSSHQHGMLELIASTEPSNEESRMAEASRRIGTIMLEAGIIFHSVIIGLTLGIADFADWRALVVAIAFHQLFEGMALGVRIAEMSHSLVFKTLVLGMLYILTTPIACAIGIGVRSVLDFEDSSTAVLIQGIFNSLSAGILMYTGYVELLAAEINYSRPFQAQTRLRKALCFLSMYVGAASMAVVGIWA